ncbi:MAG: adenosylmethionine--8-amino-7-oxononanoate transaminase [Cyclobacteriaceae bacterium]
MTELERIDRQNIWHPFSPLAGNKPIPVEKARGCYLYTTDGRKILDAISSWWVNIHGHGNPAIAQAIADQARELEQVIFAGFTHRPAVQLSELLMRILPSCMDKLFFSDNGSTSTEVAIKLSIQYWYNRGHRKRKVIAIEGAYHGDTFGAMSVGDRGSIFNVPFKDLLFDVEYLSFPDETGSDVIAQMKNLATEDTAAFIFEPLVQGAAGMRIYEARVLDELISIAKSRGILCIADEVMTGFGRTGKNLACDYLEQDPDIICLSKGITGGFLPMGVTAVSKQITAGFDSTDKSKAFFHGHSYTANPLACAAAVASTELLLTSEVQAQISSISKSHKSYIKQFRFIEKVASIKSQGTILSIELPVEDSGYVSHIKEKIYDYFMERNLLLRPLGNVIYLIPPYVITTKELKTIYATIDQFLSDS